MLCITAINSLHDTNDLQRYFFISVQQVTMCCDASSGCGLWRTEQKGGIRLSVVSIDNYWFHKKCVANFKKLDLTPQLMMKPVYLWLCNFVYLNIQISTSISYGYVFHEPILGLILYKYIAILWETNMNYLIYFSVLFSFEPIHTTLHLSVTLNPYKHP
jgi:hypothetical protein